MKSSALSLEVVNQISYSTRLSGLSKLNETIIPIESNSVYEALFMKFSNFYPSAFDINIDGMVIPPPVPSSVITIYSGFSFSLSSIMIATANPEFSIFLTFFTNVHSPLSAMKNAAWA
jgi:hypothetical protein